MYPAIDPLGNLAASAAKRRLDQYIANGRTHAEALLRRTQAMVPRDRYRGPDRFRFVSEPQPGNHARLMITFGEGRASQPFMETETMPIHPHGVGQLADISGLTRAYKNRLLEQSEPWRIELLAHNLNTLFKEQSFLNRLKQPAEFLHRVVNNELRAVLTQSYNRHLLSFPMLNAFLEAAQEFQAVPTASLATDTKVALQVYLPYVFEPIPGQYVAVGAHWGNSDFGAGKLKISHTLMRPLGGGQSITSETYGRVHLGSVVQAGDIQLSDDVAAKEVDTVCTAIQSAVRTVLQPDAVEAMLAAIRAADEENLPWRNLQGQLKNLLTRDETKKLRDMLDQRPAELPPPGHGADGAPLPTRWWASSALGYLAEHTLDPERKADLQTASGQILAGEKVDTAA